MSRRPPPPETAAPETAAPETAAPETAAPETAAPETAAAPIAPEGGAWVAEGGHLLREADWLAARPRTTQQPLKED